MIIKYYINICHINGRVERGEYTEETKKYLFTTNGRKTLKNSSHKYFNTWQEAKDRLVKVQSIKVAKCVEQLRQVQTTAVAKCAEQLIREKEKQT